VGVGEFPESVVPVVVQPVNSQAAATKQIRSLMVGPGRQRQEFIEPDGYSMSLSMSRRQRPRAPLIVSECPTREAFCA
jgi:hypothetical protein